MNDGMRSEGRTLIVERGQKLDIDPGNFDEVKIVPKAPIPEDINEEDLMEKYSELNMDQQRIKGDLRESEEKARKWRRTSWIWRGVSLIFGFILGVLSNVIL